MFVHKLARLVVGLEVVVLICLVADEVVRSAVDRAILEHRLPGYRDVESIVHRGIARELKSRNFWGSSDTAEDTEPEPAFDTENDV